jgi:hypothetical protein
MSTGLTVLGALKPATGRGDTTDAVSTGSPGFGAQLDGDVLVQRQGGVVRTSRR